MSEGKKKKSFGGLVVVLVLVIAGMVGSYFTGIYVVNEEYYSPELILVGTPEPGIYVYKRTDKNVKFYTSLKGIARDIEKTSEEDITDLGDLLSGIGKMLDFGSDLIKVNDMVDDGELFSFKFE